MPVEPIASSRGWLCCFRVTASPGKTLCRDHCSCTNIKQKMCSWQSNPHYASFVFAKDVQIIFFFSYRRGKKSLSRNYTFKSCVYQRNRKDTICRTYYSLLHISFSATVNSLLTAGTEESENGTGKKAAGFVLKSPLERLPVSYRCASMGAGRAAPSLGARLHCSAFWSSLVTRLPAFIMSLGLDGTCKVCDNKYLGRGRQSNQVTV